METNTTEFAERLAARMAAAGITELQLSSHVTILGWDCTKENVMRWLDGGPLPRSGAIPYIASALGCTADDLLGTILADTP